MRQLIAGILGIASVFLAASVFAAGTASVKIDTLAVGSTLTLGSANLAKVPVMTDSAGTKFDSGALALVSGSQTVTTSLTTCNRVFYSIAVDGAGSATSFKRSISGAGFTIYGYDPVTGATSTSNFTGDWMAIDE